MPHSNTVTFLSYWRGLQPSDHQAPLRGAFNPARLKPMIANMMMIGCDEEGYRFRLAGGFLKGLHAKDLKDHAFLTLFLRQYNNPLKAALTRAQETAQPLVLRVFADWEPLTDKGQASTEVVQLEILLCPLCGPDGTIDRFVGHYQTLGVPPRSIFGQVGAFNLKSVRLLEANQRPVAPYLKLVAFQGSTIHAY